MNIVNSTSKRIATLIVSALFLVMTMGCAATSKHESTGEYIDDSVITTSVKAEILDDKDLKVMEINVETYKGVVQLSGFVNSESDIKKAAKLAGKVNGVKSVKNDMRVK